MHHYHSAYFENLAVQARSGDLVAKQHLRRELEEKMIHIVRRALKDGQAATALDRRILAEARRVRANRPLFAYQDQERLIAQVADCVARFLLARLAPTTEVGFATDETIRRLA